MTLNMADVKHRQNKETQAQLNNIQQWTVKASPVLNDIQLKQLGMSPLQKQFGHVMGPPTAKKRKRTSDQEHGRKVSRVKATGSTSQI
jgi:hypothetical protein